MKKLLIFCISLICLVSAFFLPGCAGEDLKTKYAAAIEKEMKGSFDFFWNEANTKEGDTYGLIVDRWPNADGYASIASVGFGLAAYAVGCEEGWVSKEDASARSLKTLQALRSLQQRDDVAWSGFFSHFIDMNTGARYENCEISSVDTAILICGALTAGEYFGGEVQTAAQELYANVNWKAFEITKSGKTYISMSYEPSKGAVSQGAWDWYAEQLMIYVLGAGSPTEEFRLDDKTYYDFTRKTGAYSGESFIYSYFGSIFTYQYSHAFVNFNGIVDKNGTDWYANSVAASRAAYDYCRDRAAFSLTFEKGGWGLTACDAPTGYNGNLGAPPRGWTPDANYVKYEGTVAPAGAIGSVVFTPKESLEALEYYQSMRLLNSGAYGLLDSYNLDRDYYATQCIGIDKGISLVMLSNYTKGTVWEAFNKNQNVLGGLEALGFTKK